MRVLKRLLIVWCGLDELVLQKVHQINLKISTGYVNLVKNLREK